MSVPILPFEIKDPRRSLVLRLIKEFGPISRGEIAERTGFISSTVANITNDLIEAGLVKEGRQGPSQGGRRPMLLELNGDCAYVIGVNVGYSNIVAILANAGGTVIRRAVVPTEPWRGSDAVLQSIASAIKELFTDTVISVQKVRGIGVGVPGLVDPRGGISIFSPNLEWRNVYVADKLSRLVGIPVIVDNDVRMATLGEWRYGAGEGSNDFIALFVGSAVGCGLVLNSKLHYGVCSTAGEIGHTIVEPDGPHCSCGRDGCLEAVASGRAIAASATAGLKLGINSSLAKAVGDDMGAVTAALVAEHAAAGDPFCSELMKKTGSYLGSAIAALVNTLNPEIVAIGGGVSRAGNLLFQPIKDSYRERAIQHIADSVRIIPAELGKDAGPRGAAALVIDRLMMWDVYEATVNA